MKNYYQLVTPTKTPFSIYGFFLGVQLTNATPKNYFFNSNKDFAGYKAYLKYRYWEANQITDQV
jgi:hypothetical protein